MGDERLARADIEDVLRHALRRMEANAMVMLESWERSNPIRQGEMWKNLKEATAEATQALRSIPDPKPGQCTTVWYDVLDALWDRCGLPHHHPGQHVAEYATKAGLVDGA